MLNMLFDTFAAETKSIDLYVIISKNPANLTDSDFITIGNLLREAIDRDPSASDAILNSTIISLFSICGGMQPNFDATLFINGCALAFADYEKICGQSDHISDLLRHLYTINTTTSIDMMIQEYDSLTEVIGKLRFCPILIGVMYKCFLDIFIRAFNPQIQTQIRELTNNLVSYIDTYDIIVSVSNEFIRM